MKRLEAEYAAYRPGMTAAAVCAAVAAVCAASAAAVCVVKNKKPSQKEEKTQ